MDRFVDRVNEMATLEAEYGKDCASFVVVYGRRRVGKTTLIEHFCNGKRALYFLATQESELENRKAFSLLVAESFDNELLRDAKLDSWMPIFNLIAEESKKERIILVMDEFQYLGRANSAFPSIMQKAWDEVLSKADIMLILCGSLINMMTSQVLNYDSPLYGRRTAQIRLRQVGFSYYHEFDASLDRNELIEHYAVTGGVPKYIELFMGEKDIMEAIRKNILSTSAFLYAEPEFLLQKEVSEIGSYFSLLKTIAAGNHKLSKIATAMGVPQTRLTSYLKTLSELDVIEREVPITEESPEKSKMGLYRIKDNFLSFWFKFVYPNRALLETGHMEYVSDRIEGHFIDNHASYVYEDICRESVWEDLAGRLAFNRVGRWWGSGDVEIDILAYDSLGNDIVFGECKYSKNKKGVAVLSDLKAKAAYVSWNKGKRNDFYVIYSRSGFTDKLIELSEQDNSVILIEN